MLGRVSVQLQHKQQISRHPESVCYFVHFVLDMLVLHGVAALSVTQGTPAALLLCLMAPGVAAL